MKKVEDLKAGEVLLMDAKKVNGGKIQLQFAEQIKNPNSRPQGIAGLLNASDDRFSSNGKARRAWVAGTSVDIQAMLGIDVSSLDDAEVGTVKEFGILNPQYGNLPLHIQITETTEGDDYQMKFLEKTAKKAGSEGAYLYFGGKHIFSNTTIVAGEAQHIFLKADAPSSAPSTSVEDAVSDAIGE